MDCDYFLRSNIVNQPPATGTPPPDWNLNYIPRLVHVVYECPCHLDIFATGARARWGWAHNSLLFELVKNVMCNVLYLFWLFRRESGIKGGCPPKYALISNKNRGMLHHCNSMTFTPQL